MSAKKFVFTVILLLPALFLFVIVALTACDLYEISRIDPGAVYRDLKDAIPRRYPHSFPLPENIDLLDRSKTVIYAVGESSLVLSDGGVFPEYLESDHDGVQVVNLGVSAIDSLTIRQRVEEALTAARPDVMVLYYGHNDYNVAYHLYILPKYFHQFDHLLRLAYLFYDSDRPAAAFADGEYDVFARLNRPKLFQFFQRIGLIRIRADDYAPVNQLILNQYVRNNQAIMDMAASRKIPVVLITPVGNLHAEPFGDIRAVTRYYRAGMAEKDYGRSIDELTAARDAEFWTYDLRAKSPLIEYIRNIRRPNVYVLDLERKLRERRFGFGNEDFVDYFHFNDRSHRMLANIIYDFLRKNDLVGRRRGAVRPTR